MSESGTQAIRRAGAILRAIARFGPGGARLIDLSRTVGLARPTTHRIVSGLIAEMMVVQNARTKRYQLGPLIFELGLATTQRSTLPEICRPALRRLAELTHDTVYLVVRSGFDVVCLDRAEGSYPIRAITLDIGGRRPLGLGAGGAALLATYPDDEIGQIIDHHCGTGPTSEGVTPEMLWNSVAEARREGCGRNQESMSPGIRGIGAAIPTDGDHAFAAISIGCIAERMTKQRSSELCALLHREVAELAEQVSAAVRSPA
jgi:DNA-binding IclR family transcriptional regulator